MFAATPAMLNDEYSDFLWPMVQPTVLGLIDVQDYIDSLYYGAGLRLERPITLCVVKTRAPPGSRSSLDEVRFP